MVDRIKTKSKVSRDPTSVSWIAFGLAVVNLAGLDAAWRGWAERKVKASSIVKCWAPPNPVDELDRVPVTVLVHRGRSAMPRLRGFKRRRSDRTCCRFRPAWLHHLRGFWFGPKAGLGAAFASSEDPRGPISVVRIVIPLGAARTVDTTGPVNLRRTGDAKSISGPETG